MIYCHDRWDEPRGRWALLCPNMDRKHRFLTQCQIARVVLTHRIGSRLSGEWPTDEWFVNMRDADPKNRRSGACHVLSPLSCRHTASGHVYLACGIISIADEFHGWSYWARPLLPVRPFTSRASPCHSAFAGDQTERPFRRRYRLLVCRQLIHAVLPSFHGALRS
jgi:hypothetical protein